MTYAQVMKLSPDTIPVIDLAPLRDANTGSKSGTNSSHEVGRALHAASQGLGFIYVENHGIPEHIISQARSSAYDFFHASPQDKATVKVSPEHRGWLAQGGAKMSDDALPDLKESYIWEKRNENK